MSSDVAGGQTAREGTGRDRKGQEGKVIHTNYLTTVDIAGFTGIQEHLMDDRSVSHVAACQQTGISVTIRCTTTMV